MGKTTLLPSAPQKNTLLYRYIYPTFSSRPIQSCSIQDHSLSRGPSAREEKVSGDVHVRDLCPHGTFLSNADESGMRSGSKRETPPLQRRSGALHNEFLRLPLTLGVVQGLPQLQLQPQEPVSPSLNLSIQDSLACKHKPF